MKATVSAILRKMKSWWEESKSCLEKLKANPEEMKSIVEHPEVPKEKAAVNCQSTKEVVLGVASSHRLLPTAAEMDPGWWRVLEELGHRPQRDYLPCSNGRT
jgi:hypothetical protein